MIKLRNKYKQDNLSNCGITCLRVLLDHFGYKYDSLESLLNDYRKTVKPFLKEGLSTVDNALFLLKKGFDVEVYSFWLEKMTLSKNLKRNLFNLEKESPIFKKISNQIKKFINSGGRFKIDFLRELDESFFPSLILVNESVLYENNNISKGHFIILLGKKDNIIYYYDPLDGETHIINFSKLLLAVHSICLTSIGYLIKLKKK
jgi:hypothetical protein